jgi:hypothetical protein
MLVEGTLDSPSSAQLDEVRTWILWVYIKYRVTAFLIQITFYIYSIDIYYEEIYEP